MSDISASSIRQLAVTTSKASVPAEKRSTPVTMRKAKEAIFVFPEKPLSVLQRRLFNACVYFAQRNPGHQSWVVQLSQLEPIIGYNDSSNRRYIMGELISLMKAHVIWDATVNPQDRRLSASTLLADVTHLVDQRAYEFSFSPKLREVLLNPEIWQRIDLAISQRFRSMGTAPLYEWCKRYERTGLTSRWAWEDFRHAVVGIVEEESIYQQYKFFKSKILKRAIAEVNDLSDIEVTLKEYKNGRVVEQIQFEVRRKNGARPAVESESDELISAPSVTALLEDVLRIGVTPNRAAQIINEYTPTDIRAALNHTVLRDAATNKEPLKNRASFFICSLEKGYAKPSSLTPAASPTEPTAPLLTDASLRESFMRSRDPLAEASFLAMALDEQANVLHDYNSSAPHDQLRYDPAKKAKLSKTAFIRYLNLRLWGEPSDADVYAFHFPKAVA
ncbi:replication initiation protein [Burkholderia vietnamiensis]|jgi:Initiator Replication protein|uniref:Initiator RepB protein n=1 Tax=Burkholderia aenigmatica TaxID=2015348 RepID=A0A228HQ22_9BURK|nr:MULTISPECIES: replication initiation protein [Burkholderia]HDR9758017.1 replication initiation protein [Burkholderia cepacia ATCC 25416]MBR7919621.1 replication initiation protein [Burkholderia vietnamiensis]MBR8054544.1 replication initiation protein [Burkholderia vietnamiensis]MDN7456208.1 replication initiation protein [Burkholderia cenocepacia]OXI32002.1 replication initiation protein [Burkholderia aenigmatica]